MNRYPIWKYSFLLFALAFGLLYALPNFFGEAPAIQIVSQKMSIPLDVKVQTQVADLLKTLQIKTAGISFEKIDTNAVLKIRFQDTDTQLKAKDLLEEALNPDPKNPGYIIALNLLSNAPSFFAAINALPMYLGLDLRGGVHFLLQTDITSIIKKNLDAVAKESRDQLQTKQIPYKRLQIEQEGLLISFANNALARQALAVLEQQNNNIAWQASASKLRGELTDAARSTLEAQALEKNRIILHKRVNELGVAEPVIQQQGKNRIIVQLPGVQDIAKAKDIIGRTATLEARLVDLSVTDPQAKPLFVPSDSELFTEGTGTPVVLKKQVIFSGENIIQADAGFEQQFHRPAVSIVLDSAGGRVLRRVSQENINKPMAIVLFEKDRGEVLTVANIMSELGTRFEITGSRSIVEAKDLALLLRAGALAAPMDIIEEKTIGPSLGSENIKKGWNSLVYGFCALSVFMLVYYLVFGLISVLALGLNILLLVAALSLLQATLTLPGIAAMALTLGMAIDANVLINERIREELRAGSSPQIAIQQGFSRAWNTIFDSNITTLIAGIALLVFGSGPIRGFAVVHCLGIATSMFSAVFFARGLVNLYYGRKQTKRLLIG